MIVAALYNHSDEKYIPAVELFFASCAIIGVIVGLALNIADRNRGGKLNSINGEGDFVDDDNDDDDESESDGNSSVSDTDSNSVSNP
jgi:hypothetical protein